MLDKNSIIVAYDYERGEPRGKEKKADLHPKVKTEEEDCKCTDCKGNGACKEWANKFNSAEQNGDCIDCAACVRVCPTGIDIRNGTQLECINCTACIDACDAVMVKLHKPKGLIRYASEHSISAKQKLKLNTKIKAYSFVLMLLLSLLVFFLVSRTDLDVRLMRTAGMTYTTLADGRISNLYNLKLTNKTHKDIRYSIKLENMDGEIDVVGKTEMIIKKEDYSHCQFFVILSRDQVKSWKTQLVMGVYENGIRIKKIEAKFIGPEIYN